MKKIRILILCSMFYFTVGHARVLNHYAEDKPMELVTIEMTQHNVLRTRAQEVTFPLDAKTQTFIQQLREFLEDLKSPLAKPAGLAAPQVGLSERIIIIQVPPEAKTMRKDVFDVLPPTVWINPSYTPVEKDGKNKDWEGCYSVSNKMGEVYRYNTIQYKAFTPEGKHVNGIARGFLARLIQHEVGHLNGELYIDLLCADCRFGSLDDMMLIRKKEMEQERKKL